MTKKWIITCFTLSVLLTCSFMFKSDLTELFSLRNLQLSEDGILSGVIDLGNLDNYANQAIPNYITKDNTTNNSISNTAATLGRVLFYDKNLSVNGTVSCGSCHLQSVAFNDTAQASVGVNGTTGRHAMRLVNARFGDEVQFFWDERAATLEIQTTQPIQDHAEMGFSGTQNDPDLDSLIRKLQQIDYYNTLFDFVFGDTVITEARMQMAMAQFIRSIQSFDAKYDVGRAQVGADVAPFPNFTAAENAGKQLFFAPPQFDNTGSRIGGGAGCQGCHRAPEFDIDPNSLNNGVTGVIGGGSTDLTVTRSPSLRDVVDANGNVNGPLMHTGSFNTLLSVINHYNSMTLNPNLDPRLRPFGNPQQLNLTVQEKNNLIAFLQTLTGSNVYTDLKWSDPFSGNGLTVIPVATNTDEVEKVAKFKVYPNPVQTYLQLECDCNEDGFYVLFDLTGRMVQQGNLQIQNQAQINVASLPAGMYLLQIRNADGRIMDTQKIMKRD